MLMVENTVSNNELLSPSEALNRFIPTEQLGAAWSTQDTEQTQYGFRAGNVGLIADLVERSEVINQFTLCSIPNTPAWFSGVINLRGNLIPVFDLEILFDKQKGHVNYKYLLVIGKGESAAGILVNQLPIMLRGLEECPELPELPEVLSNHVSKAYTQANDYWLEFDHKDFFTEIGKQVLI